MSQDRIASFGHYSYDHADNRVEIRIQVPIDILFAEEIL